MMSQVLMAAGEPLLVCDSADFDGTNDYTNRGADLDGNANSKLGIVSMWLRVDGGDGVDARPFVSGSGATVEFRTQKTNNEAFRVIGENAAGTIILNIVTSASVIAAGATWKHVLASWDMAGGAGGRHLYINDASDLTVVTFTDDTIDYTQADWSAGARMDGNEKLDGCIAELYFAPGQYLDFSVVSHRRRFISGSGKPVFLGATGALPTGTAPLVYFHLDNGEAVANFATNRGTGGNFTITGTLTTGSTSPSD